jgi:hypothetical protein
MGSENYYLAREDSSEGPGGDRPDPERAAANSLRLTGQIPREPPRNLN